MYVENENENWRRRGNSKQKSKEILREKVEI